jgi:putative membrane protein
MGGADIIPGVSGGTVALILGIYERLVTAISRFDLALLGKLRQGRWAEAAAHVDLRFLVALGCGILTGVVGLASLMNYLLEHQLQPTLAVFFGLILASSLLVARAVERWNAAGLILALLGASFAWWLVAQPFMTGSDTYGYLFLCGMVAICAMILPGISGAFILLIMGEYYYVTGVIRSLKDGQVTLETVLVLAMFAAGCAIGLLGFSKFLRWLLARRHAETMAVLCGFMIGSLRKIWPFKQAPAPGEAVDLRHGQLRNAWPDAIDAQVVLVIVLAVLAIGFVLALDWLTRRRVRQRAADRPYSSRSA